MQQSDVSLHQTVTASDIPQPGDSIAYTLHFTNTGPGTAHNVTINDVLPTALVNPVVVSSGVAVTARTGSSLVWDVADLPAGQTGTITISATIDPEFSGMLANVVNIDTTARESDLVNNAPDPSTTMLYIYEGAPTSVTLVSFAATPVERTIVLTWETVSELDVLGFNLYRAEAGHPIKTKLNQNLIPAKSPGSVQGEVYTYTDSSVAPGTVYYWLESVSLNSTAELHGPVSAMIEAQQPTLHRVFLPFVVNQMP